MGNSPLTTIVTTEELAARLADPDWAIVDARFDLVDPSAGRRAYEAAHVPGAVFADLDEDLSGPRAAGTGRHPLPDVDRLAARLGEWGIDGATQVVVYDAADGMYASRLWWLLRYHGHDAVAVLDGGFARWQAEGRATRSGTESRPPRRFASSLRAGMAVSADDVERMRDDPRRRLVDSRAPDRYRGQNETIDPVAGHIPGARNHFFKRNVREDGALLEPERLREQFTGVLAGVDPDRTVVYCGSGVTACQNLLALEHAGLRGAVLYPGSWSEWVSDPTRPVATGSDP